MPKRFDTWFFLAAAPPEQSARTTARNPPTRSGSRRARRWKAAKPGASSCIPTTRNLIKLGKQESVKAALDDSRGKPVVTVMRS